jgi:hypothetical protein
MHGHPNIKIATSVARFVKPNEPPEMKLHAAGVCLIPSVSIVPPRIEKLTPTKQAHVSNMEEL